MSETQGYSESTPTVPDRRAHSRRRALPLAYIELGGNNGGIVLNISAGGLAITAAEELLESHLPRMRFELPQSNVRVEATGQIAWISESKKEAGVRFANLSEEAATQISEWLSSEAWDSGAPSPARGVHTSTRRPFSTMLPAEPSASRYEPTAPKLAEEGPREASILGRSFAAALQRSRAQIATASPVQTTDMADQLRSALVRPILTAGMGVEESQRRWWAATALVSLLALISFVAGMATGAGGWGGALRLLSRKTARLSEPAQIADPAGRSGHESAPASVPVADGAATHESDSPSAKSQDPIPAPRDTRANHSPGEMTPAAPAGRASQKASSALLLQLPETPVSASASVAITSRRSVQVAPEIAALAMQQGQNVQIGQLLHHVEPFYPLDAKRQGLEGKVELRVTVGRDGRIRTVQVSSGPPQLAEAAANAIREWRYKPTLLNGHPIDSEVDFKLTFRLPRK